MPGGSVSVSLLNLILYIPDTILISINVLYRENCCFTNANLVNSRIVTIYVFEVYVNGKTKCFNF